jgi:glycosyltransferase involved in cell wall biosynthesis
MAPRVLGLLVGDITAPGSGAQVKYGRLFAELGARCELLAVCDVELRGLERSLNALGSIRPSRRAWRAAFHKNTWSFARHSRNAERAVVRYPAAEVVFQHGAIFHAHGAGRPVVIYTDFTHRLAEREDNWRNPLAATASDRWDALEHEAYQAAAMVLTRSEHARRSLLEDYRVPPGRTAVVGGGVNFERLPDVTPLAAAPRVLFIGKDFERKGGDLLLAAFARAREQVPDAELWLVTARSDVGGPGVRHIAPTYDRQAVAELYRGASVFAMPSRCETWGDVFLEAMAYGLPCIAADADAMPEIVAHGRTGLLAPPGDVTVLTQALVTLLADEGLRRRMGAAGRERVETTFTWAHVAERIVPSLARAVEHHEVRGHAINA